jgi:hypothetical protein
MMTYKDDEEVKVSFKCKGVRTTEDNRKVTSYENIFKLIESTFMNTEKEPLIADTMCIHPNSTNALIPYGTLCTRYGKKEVDTVFTKRLFKTNKEQYINGMEEMALVRLVPYGYEGDASHISIYDEDVII